MGAELHWIYVPCAKPRGVRDGICHDGTLAPNDAGRSEKHCPLALFMAIWVEWSQLRTTHNARVRSRLSFAFIAFIPFC